MSIIAKPWSSATVSPNLKLNLSSQALSPRLIRPLNTLRKNQNSVVWIFSALRIHVAICWHQNFPLITLLQGPRKGCPLCLRLTCLPVTLIFSPNTSPETAALLTPPLPVAITTLSQLGLLCPLTNVFSLLVPGGKPHSY